jgi:hypothetical protein
VRPQWNRSKRPRTALSVALVSVALCALSVAPATPLRAPIVIAAGNPTYVDVSPEHGTGAIGDSVTLTATVYDDDGVLSTASNTHVKFRFTPGDPNDPDTPGNNPDLDCVIDNSGTCSVSYVAAVGGTDTICALLGGPVSQCAEGVDAPELDDRADVVEHTSGSGGPSPSPSPTPTPASSP